MIHGLVPQLNEAGKIKIGQKGAEIESAKGTKFRPPVKYDHFEITTTERDKKGDLIINMALIDRIKKNGGLVNDKGGLIGIPIRFLYNDTDLNFKTELVSYAGKHLSCRGNGKESFKRVSDFEKAHECPCPRIEPDYTGKDKCKYFGTLTCIIDEAGLLGQAHKFRTTSRNSVLGILGGIELIKTATGGTIAGLPLMLTLNPKTTTIPGGGTTTVFVVSICYRGSMADLRADALAIVQEQSQYKLSIGEIEDQVKQLPAPAESETEQAEVAKEFFPDTVDGEIVSETDVEPEPGENEEPENSPPEKETQTYTQPNDLKRKGLPPEGDYTVIYERLLEEKDADKAIALMKRLKKENILYWLSIFYPDIDADPSQKKPEIVALATKVLKSTLTCPVEDADQTDTTQKETDTDTQDPAPEEKTEPQKYPREWDNSGPITKYQCRQLVHLKEALTKAGKISADPESWRGNVNYFLDKDGKPISKATQLTTVQGANFIEALKSHLPDDDIPF